MTARDELVTAIAGRYSQADRTERGRILDEFTAVTGFHRKHAMRLLRAGRPNRRSGPRPGRRVYDDAAREALIVIWEASDRICGKRLRPLVPVLVEAILDYNTLKSLTFLSVTFGKQVTRRPFMAGRASLPAAPRARHPAPGDRRATASRADPVQADPGGSADRPGGLGAAPSGANRGRRDQQACRGTIWMGRRIASSENVTRHATVASSNMLPLPHAPAGSALDCLPFERACLLWLTRWSCGRWR